jgi:hypothetical protein
MPFIEISDKTFIRLQAFATPLVDSPDTALRKVLTFAESAQKNAGTPDSSATPALSKAGPNLKYTTVTSATINGHALPNSKCNWNALMLEVVKQAAKQLPEGTPIRALIVVNHVSGQKEDTGYKYLKELGVSIQGQNSNNAWKAISHLAQATGVKVEVGFYWENHPHSAKPGEQGHLLI